MYKEAWNRITAAKHIVLISHLNPDGDALGSSLALYPLLKEMGKQVTVVNKTSPLPKRYDFLPNFAKIKPTLPNRVDLIISFDCGSIDRLGLTQKQEVAINIDHHKTNTHYAKINLIEPNMASTSSVVLKLLEENQIALRKDVATCIYTALVEDTGFFAYENVTANVFKTAAKLCHYKIEPSNIAQLLKEREPLAKLRLTSLLIDKIELIKNGEVGYAILRLEDFQKTGATRSDSDECVDIIRSLATVELAILLIEEEQSYKISLRSKKRLDVSKIALSLGGGGHQRAAGFTTQKRDPKNIIQDILQKVQL